MRIYTCYADKKLPAFVAGRRKSSNEWRFLFSGEWSDSPYHEGNVTFYIRSSTDKRFWALLSVGFPSRIVAVAETTTSCVMEEVAAQMMRKTKLDGGPYIRHIHRHGEIRVDRFWEHFRMAGD
jgi:hypothetical protein